MGFGIFIGVCLVLGLVLVFNHYLTNWDLMELTLNVLVFLVVAFLISLAIGELIM